MLAVPRLVAPASAAMWLPVTARAMSSTSLRAALQPLLEEIKEAGTWKTERQIASPQDMVVTVANPDGTTSEVLNFCANNYLGLSNHPRVVKAAHESLDSHGFGMSSVRFICGTSDIHTALERQIAEFHGTEACILYPSCFDANASLFEALLTKEDAVLSDELNHASIIDGIRLCKAKRGRYKHRDMADLEQQLKDSQDARLRMIATDGVFSMDGTVAPLQDICVLAEQYDAAVFIDECHATGFLGATGRGTPEFCGVGNRVDIINSTLGKALGGATGGYTAGPKEVVDMLRQKGRPYLFSNAVAPSVVGASIEVFNMLTSDSTLVARIQSNTKRFRERMTAAGFTLNGDDHPICPVMLGDDRMAGEMADRLLAKGIYVIGFTYPVVPKGKARIRVQLSAAHTEEQVDAAIDAFVEVGKEFGVIS